MKTNFIDERYDFLVSLMYGHVLIISDVVYFLWHQMPTKCEISRYLWIYWTEFHICLHFSSSKTLKIEAGFTYHASGDYTQQSLTAAIAAATGMSSPISRRQRQPSPGRMGGRNPPSYSPPLPDENILPEVSFYKQLSIIADYIVRKFPVKVHHLLSLHHENEVGNYPCNHLLSCMLSDSDSYKKYPLCRLMVCWWIVFSGTSDKHMRLLNLHLRDLKSFQE